MARRTDKTASSRSNKPQWRLIEQAVRILEESLDPGARVTHDEQLRELVTGTPPQCDVVIRSGPRHRRTLTIVEVQKRKSKVDIQDYEAWIQKRDKVGAQHLICVSAVGFTGSVEKDALLRGDGVRLMTLCEPGARPSFYRVEAIEMLSRNLLGRDVEIVLAGPTSAMIAPSDAERVFTCASLDGPVSIDEIVTAYARTGPPDSRRIEQLAADQERHQFTIDCRFDDWLTWFHREGAALPVLSLQVVERYATAGIESGEFELVLGSAGEEFPQVLVHRVAIQ